MLSLASGDILRRATIAVQPPPHRPAAPGSERSAAPPPVRQRVPDDFASGAAGR